jgi:hypothetical protein
MLLIILAIIFIIILIYIFVHLPGSREVLRYNTNCETCGRKKGILKCQVCGV